MEALKMLTIAVGFGVAVIAAGLMLVVLMPQTQGELVSPLKLVAGWGLGVIIAFMGMGWSVAVEDRRW